MEQKYFIWSFEHNAWWRSDRLGYTEELAYAGFYSHAEALSICLDANVNPEVPNEAMVPISNG